MPFRVTPDLNFARIWADRKMLKRDVDAVMRTLVRSGPSTLHPVWGWYGAGKTHVLYHMLGECRKGGNAVGAAFTEVPAAITGFVDLYRHFASDLLGSGPEIGAVFQEVWTERLRQNRQDFVRAICPGLPDFLTAMNYLSSGMDVHKETVSRYLVGARVPIYELRTVGIGSRIETDEEAIEAFSSFVRLSSLSARLKRIVWFIDELQNLSTLPARTKTTVQLGLEQLFNKCPNNLSLVLAYSGRQQDRISKLVSGAFVSRMGAQRRISIPPMEQSDAVEFIRDLLLAFRTPGRAVQDEFFPFEEASVKAVLAYMANEDWYLKPRSIMECFRAVLEEAEPLFLDEDMEQVDANFALEVLKNLASDPSVVESLKRID